MGKQLWQRPVFFDRNRVYRVYLGGKLFHDFLGDAPEDGFYPEEWVASTVHAMNAVSKGPFEGISMIEGTIFRLRSSWKSTGKTSSAAAKRSAYWSSTSTAPFAFRCRSTLRAHFPENTFTAPTAKLNPGSCLPRARTPASTTASRARSRGKNLKLRSTLP